MRRFLVEEKNDFGDEPFIAEVGNDQDISLELCDGREPDDREQEILEKLDIVYDPEEFDSVYITDLELLEVRKY